MSSAESPANNLERLPRRRIQRRHGACEPCRSSKTKCDGRMPCGACRSERRRQCPCKYSEKAMKLQQVTAEFRRRAESERRGSEVVQKPHVESDAPTSVHEEYPETAALSVSTEDIVEGSSFHHRRERRNSERGVESAKMSHSLSVCAAIEEFKRLKPARGYSAQVVSRCNGFEAMKAKSTNGSFDDGVQPRPVHLTVQPDYLESEEDVERLQSLQGELQWIDSLIQEGCLNRAWIRLASIVREAQAITATAKDKSSTTTIEATLGELCGNVFDLEAQLSLLLGRSTCLPPSTSQQPNLKDTLPLEEESIESTRIDLHQRIQGVLSLDLSSTTAIRDFLEKAREILNHEPFNKVGLCTTEEHSSAARDLQLDTHLLFMVVYCRMASLCDSFSRDLTNGSWSDTPAANIIRDMSLHQPRQKLTCCRKMFRSANFILNAFISLQHTNAKQTGRNWLRCHSAYVAAVILGIAKLRHEVEWHATTEILRKMEQIFVNLSKAHESCQLFESAALRLQDLNSVKEPASESVRNQNRGMKNRKRSAPSSTETSPKGQECRTLAADSTSTASSPTISFKRAIDFVDEPVMNNPMARSRYALEHLREEDEYSAPSTTTTSFDDIQLDHLPLWQDNSATYSQSSSTFTNNSVSSSATSFSDGEMPVPAHASIPNGHPGPPFVYPFPYDVLHPPMAWNNVMFPHDNPHGPALSLRVSNISSFNQGIPPADCQTLSAPSYNLQLADTDLSVKSLVVDNHHPSPLHGPGDFSSQPPNGSQLKHATPTQSSFGSSCNHISQDRHFSRQVNKSLQGDVLVNNRQRLTPDRRHSVNTVQQPVPLPSHQRQSTVGWHDTPSVPVGVNQDLETQIVSSNLGVSSVGRRANTDDVRQPELMQNTRNEVTCFPSSGVRTPQEVVHTQLMPTGPLPYMNSAPGIYEQNQAPPSQYQPCHLANYGKYFPVQSSGPYHLQWRRSSIDTGRTTNNEF